MKDTIIKEKDKYKAIGLRGFYYNLFEEEEGVGTINGLDGYPYLKHIIDFWPGYWFNQMEKVDVAVGMNNCLMISGVKKRLVCPFIIQ